MGISYSGQKYTRAWNDYIRWHIAFTQECMGVLKQSGNLFMIHYPKQNAHLRVKYLDDAAYMVQDYVWIYNTSIGHSKSRLTTAHRSILHATISKHNNFYKDSIAMPYQNPEDKRIKARMEAGHKGRMPYS